MLAGFTRQDLPPPGLGPCVFEAAVRQGRAPSRGSEEGPSRLSELLGAPLSLACGRVTPVPASVVTGTLWVPLCVLFSSLLLRAPATGFRAHPAPVCGGLCHPN